MLRTYERLLPYAVILGILPDWAEVLRRAYEAADLAPGWLFLPGLEDHPPVTYRDFVAAGGRAAFDALRTFDKDLGPGFDGSGLQIGATPADPTTSAAPTPATGAATVSGTSSPPATRGSPPEAGAAPQIARVRRLGA